MHQMAKVLELPFSITPSNEFSGLISFRMDWLDLLAVQGTLKSLLQQHKHQNMLLNKNINSSVLNFLHIHTSEKAMATHSSALAWKIPWTEEPGGLQSMGSLGVRHD